ncbi:hypothetical protein BC826DRAFT_1001357 [Russula brevipes]|nr:hypothetical protein BC826DRAFT_1001357 [Russula brevipes]
MLCPTNNLQMGCRTRSDRDLGLDRALFSFFLSLLLWLSFLLLLVVEWIHNFIHFMGPAEGDGNDGDLMMDNAIFYSVANTSLLILLSGWRSQSPVIDL